MLTKYFLRMLGRCPAWAAPLSNVFLARRGDAPIAHAAGQMFSYDGRWVNSRAMLLPECFPPAARPVTPRGKCSRPAVCLPRPRRPVWGAAGHWELGLYSGQAR